MSTELGNKIRFLRKESQLRQEDLAEQMNAKYHLNIDRVMISKWETGFQTPVIHTLKCLADFFNVSLDYLNSPEQSEYATSKLSSDEKFLLKLYAELDAVDRKTLLTYIQNVLLVAEKYQIKKESQGA